MLLNIPHPSYRSPPSGDGAAPHHIVSTAALPPQPTSAVDHAARFRHHPRWDAIGPDRIPPNNGTDPGSVSGWCDVGPRPDRHNLGTCAETSPSSGASSPRPLPTRSRRPPVSTCKRWAGSRHRRRRPPPPSKGRPGRHRGHRHLVGRTARATSAADHRATPAPTGGNRELTGRVIPRGVSGSAPPTRACAGRG